MCIYFRLSNTQSSQKFDIVPILGCLQGVLVIQVQTHALKKIAWVGGVYLEHPMRKNSYYMYFNQGSGKNIFSEKDGKKAFFWFFF